MENAAQKHSIGKTIASLRKAKGWTQVDLAEKLQVSDKAVSKWEKDDSMPSIEFFPMLAELFGVTIDYLMMGKQEEPLFTLDDLDSTKRACYLIEKDDVENYIKYDDIGFRILYSKDIQKENRDPAYYLMLRNSIVEHQSIKIFAHLATDLLNQLKKEKNRFSAGTEQSWAGSFYDYLDDFVKLCALSNQVELLSLIKTRSLSIGTEPNSRFVDPNKSYHISQDTLDFIFSDKRIPQEVVDYFATYEPFSEKHYTIDTTWLNTLLSSNAIRMADNIVLSLYKSNRMNLLERYVESMRQEAKSSFKNIMSMEIDRGYCSSYTFRDYGYMFYNNGHGSMESTHCIGKMVVISKAMDFAIKQKDKKTALLLTEYNLYVKDFLDQLQFFHNKPEVKIVEEKAIDDAIKREKQQELYEAIISDTTITDYDRRRKLFAIGNLSIGKTIEADDYELFAQFEDKRDVSITVIAENCKDIRFFIFAVGVGQSQEKLDEALNIILSKDPERYDIIEVLLAAGATIKDNPAMTAIIKQNVQILNRPKEGSIATDIEINTEETKQHLLAELFNGRTEYVVVNLAIQLEKKLKAKYGNGIQLLDLIDIAYNNNIISNAERAMLHNLRKARNSLLHEGTEKAFFTPELVKEWIEVVFML